MQNIYSTVQNVYSMLQNKYSALQNEESSREKGRIVYDEWKKSVYLCLYIIQEKGNIEVEPTKNHNHESIEIIFNTITCGDACINIFL